MSLRVNTNVNARVTHFNMWRTDSALENVIRKLSSGLRIERASDDPGMLGMSERMRAQVRGLDMAASNAQDGMNLLGTAEGALNETHAILQRMRELVVEAATDTLTASDRSAIEQEIDILTDEISRIGAKTEFNTHKLLDGGAFAALFTLQIGPNAGDIATIGLNDMRAAAIGVAADQITVSSASFASVALLAIDGAIERVSSERDYIGSQMNMLERHVSVLNVQSQNIAQSESRIRDLDFAKAASQLARLQLLQQSATAMMAQANQQPSVVLGLLR
ncbi:MAG: flagellin [Candidatus Sericytochromatia bacterium]|nr:flagellin [Candidatus Tanganyikabacteria bacterium]